MSRRRAVWVVRLLADLHVALRGASIALVALGLLSALASCGGPQDPHAIHLRHVSPSWASSDAGARVAAAVGLQYGGQDVDVSGAVVIADGQVVTVESCTAVPTMGVGAVCVEYYLREPRQVCVMHAHRRQCWTLDEEASPGSGDAEP